MGAFTFAWHELVHAYYSTIYVLFQSTLLRRIRGNKNCRCGNVYSCSGSFDFPYMVVKMVLLLTRHIFQLAQPSGNIFLLISYYSNFV